MSHCWLAFGCLALMMMACLQTSEAFVPALVGPGVHGKSSISRTSRRQSYPPRPPGSSFRLAASVAQNGAKGEGEKEKWGEPPAEIVDDAVDRAVTLIKASGGSMDSLSFGAAWKVAYPTYDKDVFKNTCVTSFTKLLQVWHARSPPPTYICLHF